MITLLTPSELQQCIGERIKARRLALGWSQREAAERSDVAYRTWRRLEQEGQASVEDLVKAAVALRCDEGLLELFPEPPAVSMDDLLRQSRTKPTRRAAPRKRA